LRIGESLSLRVKISDIVNSSEVSQRACRSATEEICKRKRPQTLLSHRALSLTAPPPGVAHLSDALGAEMVALLPVPVAASGATVDGYGVFEATRKERMPF